MVDVSTKDISDAVKAVGSLFSADQPSTSKTQPSRVLLKRMSNGAVTRSRKQTLMRVPSDDEDFETQYQSSVTKQEEENDTTDKECCVYGCSGSTRNADLLVHQRQRYKKIKLSEKYQMISLHSFDHHPTLTALYAELLLSPCQLIELLGFRSQEKFIKSLHFCSLHIPKMFVDEKNYWPFPCLGLNLTRERIYEIVRKYKADPKLFETLDSMDLQKMSEYGSYSKSFETIPPGLPIGVKDDQKDDIHVIVKAGGFYDTPEFAELLEQDIEKMKMMHHSKRHASKTDKRHPSAKDKVPPFSEDYLNDSIMMDKIVEALEPLTYGGSIRSSFGDSLKCGVDECTSNSFLALKPLPLDVQQACFWILQIKSRVPRQNYWLEWFLSFVKWHNGHDFDPASFPLRVCGDHFEKYAKGPMRSCPLLYLDKFQMNAQTACAIKRRHEFILELGFEKLAQIIAPSSYQHFQKCAFNSCPASNLLLYPMEGRFYKLYAVPKESALRMEWVRLVRRTKACSVLPSSGFVCELHFEGGSPEIGKILRDEKDKRVQEKMDLLKQQRKFRAEIVEEGAGTVCIVPSCSVSLLAKNPSTMCPYRLIPLPALQSVYDSWMSTLQSDPTFDSTQVDKRSFVCERHFRYGGKENEIPSRFLLPAHVASSNTLIQPWNKTIPNKALHNAPPLRAACCMETENLQASFMRLNNKLETMQHWLTKIYDVCNISSEKPIFVFDSDQDDLNVLPAKRPRIDDAPKNLIKTGSSAVTPTSIAQKMRTNQSVQMDESMDLDRSTPDVMLLQDLMKNAVPGKVDGEIHDNEADNFTTQEMHPFLATDSLKNDHMNEDSRIRTDSSSEENSRDICSVSEEKPPCLEDNDDDDNESNHLQIADDGDSISDDEAPTLDDNMEREEPVSNVGSILSHSEELQDKSSASPIVSKMQMLVSRPASSSNESIEPPPALDRQDAESPPPFLEQEEM